MSPAIRHLLPALMALGATPALAVPLISMDFAADVDAANRQTFQQAADFWNSVITGYKLNSDADGLQDGIQTPHSLTITAELPAIDGLGGTLGQAGPLTVTYYDDNPFGAPTKAMYYATTGRMQFDSADVNQLVANGTFFGVVVHEMGHVLGLGSLWELNRTDPAAVGASVYDPAELSIFNGEVVGRYTGAFALAGWRREFARPDDTFVPIEQGGGSGTVDSHWNEGDGGADTGVVSTRTGLDFSKEIMTGWASDEFYLSEVTLGGLEDLGYDVDYTKAGVVTPVPEPAATAGAAALAMVALAALRRRPRG